MALYESQRERIIRHMIDAWIPLGPGESFKLLHASRTERVLLLRLEPGTVVPLHRHQGHVHAFNISGTRKLIETGEIVGPDGYVYEPPGNVDSWMAIGDEPVIVHIVSTGAMEYLGANGEVIETHGPALLQELHDRYVAEHGA